MVFLPSYFFLKPIEMVGNWFFGIETHYSQHIQTCMEEGAHGAHTHRHHHFNRNALQYWRTFISFIGFMVDRIGIWKLINWSVNGPNWMRASWRTWSHFSVKSLPFCGIKLFTAAKLQYMYVYTPYCLHIACFLSNKIHLQSCTFYVSPTPFSLLINRSSQLRFMLCVVWLADWLG